MAMRETPTWTLSLVEPVAPPLSVATLTSAAPRCPYFKLSSLQSGMVPVCGALPLVAPIAPSRERDYCRADAHLTCPHARFAAAEAARAEAESGAAAENTAGAIELLRDSGWVVGIPLCIVLVIIVALLLTQ